MADDDSSKRRDGARALLLWGSVVIAAGCSSVPPGRYPIDSVEIDRVLIPGVDTEGTRRAVPSSAIEDKIATAGSPRFLGIFPRGVVLDYELFDRYVLDRDLVRIERIYRARGYYEAKVRAGRVERTDDGHVRVTVIVQEGSRVDVGDVRFDGVASLPIDDAASVFAAVRRKLRKGSAFDEDNYQQALESIVRALGDRGYAFAKAKGHADVDLGRHVADVVLTVTPGQTARLGPITMAGLGDLPEEPVRRALDLAQGDLYSVSKLESARRAVLALGVFSDAEVTPVLGDPASRTVAVNVNLARTELREVKLGGGIELDALRADMHLLTGWENRNFLGGLRRLTLDVRPGVVLFPTNTLNFKPPDQYLLQGRARAELRQPGFLEARTGGILKGEFNLYPVIFPNEQTSGTGSGFDWVLGYRDLIVGVGLDRTFGPLYASLFYNFQTSFPFAYLHQEGFPYATIGAIPDEFASEFKKVVLSYVNLRTTLDFRDDAIRPHSGFFVGNELQVAGVPVTSNFLGGQTLFPHDLRVQPEVRGYVPITRRWTLAMRLTTGFLFPSNYGGTYEDPTKTLDPDDAQQVFFRGFFSGGPNSNRGYPFRGVGSKSLVPFFIPGISFRTRSELLTYCDPTKNPGNATQLPCSFPTGGLTLWETSVEVRFPVAGDLGGAVFCDASDVSRYRLDIRLLYPHLSCGFGIHYNTPVGPLRLDTGFQIPGLQVLDPAASPADKSSDSFYAISIGIGESF